MKKIALLGLALLTCGAGFAQMSNVKKARSKALSEEMPDFAGARELITPALTNDESKNDANTWYVAGLIDYKEAYKQYMNKMMGQTADGALMCKNAKESVPYFIKADELAQIPDAKGKVNTKIPKDVQNMIVEYFNTVDYLILPGIDLFQEGKYAEAQEAFQLWTSLPNLAVMTRDEKVQAKMSKMMGDSLYSQIGYYAGLCATRQEKYQEALQIYKSLVGKNYDQVSIYQMIADSYNQLKDTNNYVATLHEAVKLFPQEEWFLLNLINHYVYSGQGPKAVSLLDKAIAENSSEPQFYYVKGNILRELKSYMLSRQAYTKAVELKKDNADYFYNYGLTYYNEAEDVQRKADYVTDNNVFKKLMGEKKALLVECEKLWNQAAQVDPNDDQLAKALKRVQYQLSNLK